jgi:hypothetical protein
LSLFLTVNHGVANAQRTTTIQIQNYVKYNIIYTFHVLINIISLKPYKL